MRDAVSSAELVGTHVKDQTGLGGPNSLKLYFFLRLLLLLLLRLLLLLLRRLLTIVRVRLLVVVFFFCL